MVKISSRVNLKRTQTDWAGCRRKRRSTTGDTQMRDLILSKCVAKHKLLWLSVQRKKNCTALVRASAETVGLISMYKDLGTHMSELVGMQAQLSPLWPVQDWAN